MASDWTPLWVCAFGIMTFLPVLGLHLRALISTTGRDQLWHGAQVLIALGLIDIFWPYPPIPVSALTAELVFTGAAFVAAVTLARMMRIEPTNGEIRRWQILLVNLLVMIYLFTVPSSDGFVLDVLGGCFIVQALVWLPGVAPRLFSTKDRALSGLSLSLGPAALSVAMAYLLLTVHLGPETAQIPIVPEDPGMPNMHHM